MTNDTVGIANLPNQRHKIVSNRGANFTIMVCGESGVGKTTFINTLFTTTIKEVKDYRKTETKKKLREKQVGHTVEIEITKAELEEKMFKVKLSVIDTPGFGDYVNNRDSWLPIVEFVDDQHESFMRQEQQPSRGVITDMRVHCCLYFIRPIGHSLKPLDIEVMKRLGSRVNLIPVIAKADTLTPKDLEKFKKNIREVIDAQDIKVYSCPVESDDEDTKARNKSILDCMPFSIIGSTQDVVNAKGELVKGREYSWGVAEVENEEHCDFKKLRHLLVRAHMLDLISTTEEKHYENYREAQMEARKSGELKSTRYKNPKHTEKEDELRKKFTEKVKKEEKRFRDWEAKLVGERDKLNKDLESTHAQIKQMEAELENLYRNAPRNPSRHR